MALRLITGPANCGKARAVLDVVRAHAARGREPLLIVPTAADADRHRRELAQGGFVFGVRVERFDGLIDAIAAATGNVPPALGPIARERIVAAVAARTQLRLLSGAASTPGFVAALGDLIARLGAQGVSAARFGGALRAWAAADHGDGAGGAAAGAAAAGARGELAADLRALYDGYERALARSGRSDAERRATAALGALAREPALWHGRPVCLYGFDDMTVLQLDAIDTLARVVDAPVTVSLAYEAGRDAFAGRAGAFQSLLPLATEHVALPARSEHYATQARTALHHLERGLFDDSAHAIEPGDAVVLLDGGGERAELELIAGEISALLAHGVPAGEIAIAMRPSSTDPALLHEVLAAAGIPYSHQRALPFAASGVGRGLLALLRCAFADAVAGGPGGPTAAAAAAAGAGAGDGEAGAAELLAWLRAPGLLERPELADRLEAEVLTRGVREAAAARQLWERANWQLDTIVHLRAAAGRDPAALLEQVSAQAARLFAAPRRRAAQILTADERDEARALAALAGALAELDQLAAAARDLAVDAAALIGVLESLRFLAGDAPNDGAVTVSDPLALRARRVRVLFACGLQEGAFPAPAPAQPLLPEGARADLARASGLVIAPRADQLALERHLFYATVSRPLAQLYLSWHSGDDEGAPLSHSLFIDDVCDLFTADLRAARRRRALGAAAWPGPGHAPAAAAARERALRALRAAPAPVAPLSDERVLASLRGEDAVWSASGLEVYAGCPVRWFVSRLLRLRDLEGDPEPMVRGGLAHAVLEATLRGLRERTGSAQITLPRLGLARALARSALRDLEPEHPLSTAPERVPGARRRLEADLDRYLGHAAGAAGAAGALEPRELELAFGFHDSELPALDLGQDVRVRGRIDRIDTTPGGDAVVYDYKGRNAPEPARWLSDSRFQLAVYMQAAEQLLSLHAVGGFYQPLAGPDLRGRGLLASEAGLDLPHVNGDVREEALVRELLSETLAAARAAAASARDGVLVARPRGCAWRGRCEFPAFCRCEE